MTDIRKAAEMALEALETLDCGDTYKTHNAASALRQALAQPEQEPVAWIKARELELMRGFIGTAQRDWRTNLGLEKWDDEDIPLYTQPVDTVNTSQERVDKTAKREHEPFIFVREDNERPFGGYEHCSEADAGAFPVYTAPPKREWVGLTEYQRLKFADGMHISLEAVEKIEAKLKEKNSYE